MKCIIAVAWLTVIGSAMAAASGQPIEPGRKIGLVEYLKGAYAGIKTALVQAAEKMPEADFGFRPGSMPEVRTYGQLFAHVAAGQFSTCAAVKGVADANQGKDLEHELKTKAGFVKALADSFAFCDEAFSSLTDANATDFVKQGPAEVARSAALVGLIAHDAEMYGISTVYLRAKGLVPPSSERRRRPSPQ
jgi:hypothetical protein